MTRVFQEESVVELRVRFMEDGSPVDLSSASEIKIRLRKPDGTVLNQTATNYDDGADGRIKFETDGGSSGTLTALGEWEIQGYAVVSSKERYTRRGHFTVVENLEVS